MQIEFKKRSAKSLAGIEGEDDSSEAAELSGYLARVFKTGGGEDDRHREE
jgi:hypothetical protein